MPYPGAVRTAILLSCAVALAPLPAAADPEGPPPPAEEANYRTLSERTGLDLRGVWQDYLEDRDDGENFIDFTRSKFRKKRTTGIVLLSIGFGVLVFSGAMIGVGVVENEDLQVFAGGFFAAAGVALTIPGGVLLGVYQGRLNTLREAGFALGPRLRLRAAGPLALPRGAGLGLTLAF